MKGQVFLKQMYYRSTGYSYTNMGRLFLRLFVGLMLMQFGIRQMIIMPEKVLTDLNDGLFVGVPVWVSIIEIVCSFCIMIGFMTRVTALPPFIIMVVYACKYWMGSLLPHTHISFIEIFALPFLFMGILFFIIMVGPGKVSIDYYLSLYLINRNNGNESELEEV